MVKTGDTVLPCNGCTQCCRGPVRMCILFPDEDHAQWDTVLLPRSGWRMLANQPNGDCIYVTAELMHRRFDSRIVMAMAAAHQMSMLDASMDGRAVVANWIGLDRVCHFISSAAIMAQVDPVDYGLLERKGGKLTLATQPGEQWVTHMADMNWPYTMGAAHNYTWPMLKQIAEETLGVASDDSNERPINQLKNYVWSQIGQIPLYEILVREGYEAAKKTVNRLVAN